MANESLTLQVSAFRLKRLVVFRNSCNSGQILNSLERIELLGGVALKIERLWRASLRPTSRVAEKVRIPLPGPSSPQPIEALQLYRLMLVNSCRISSLAVITREFAWKAR